MQNLSENPFGFFSDLYDADITPFDAVPEDFDSDGILDLAVVNASDKLSMLFGNGDGTFAAAQNSDLGFLAGDAIGGDFDEDGNIDLAFASGSNFVRVLINNGDGSFTVSSNTYSLGDNPQATATGDFDGDAILDLAVPNLNTDNVSILIGNGDGTFGTTTNYAVGDEPIHINLGDFNDDGVLDMATANRGSDNVSIRLGNGNGTFGSSNEFVVGDAPKSVSIGDFTGDGVPDLATANKNSNNISVLRAIGDGTFSPAINYEGENAPESISSGDFDQDGLMDLAVANVQTDNVSILFNQTPAISTIEPSFSIAGEEISIHGVAFDPTSSNNTVTFGGVPGTVNSATINTLKVSVPSTTSGPAELVITNGFGSTTPLLNFTLIESNIGGAFAEANNYGAGDEANSLVAGDFDGDDIIDLAVGNRNDVNVSILIGNGDGSFGTADDFSVTAGPFASPEGIITTDLNRDGILDLVTGNYNSDEVSILLGNGDGSFGTASTISAGDGSSRVTTGDFDGDGIMDLATANVNAGNVSVLLGNGDGTFDTPDIFGVGTGPLTITLGDFNGDDNLDLVTSNIISNNVSILIGNGNGTFGFNDDYSVLGSAPYGASTGDYNGDGIIDLVTANRNSNNVSVLIGIDTGTFNGAINFFTFGGLAPENVAIGDFDNDGILDLATANLNSDDVSIMIGVNIQTDILSFTFPQQTGPPTIDTGSHTVDIAVAAGTNVSSLTPTITLSPGATISPQSGVAQDFSSPATYTVTAEDGTTMQPWMVTVVAVPEAPVLGFDGAEQTTADISWNAPAFTENFELELSTVPDFALLIGGYEPKAVSKTVLSDAITGLTVGTQYYARIRALNVNSTSSAYSTTLNILTKPATPVLDAIALPDITQTSVDISWTDVSGVFDDYQVEVSSTDFAQGATLLAGYPLTVTGSSLNIGVDVGTSPLSPGTNYWIRLRSRNSSGESGNSNVETLLTKPATPVLNAITGSDITPTSVTINWPAVAGIVDDYVVEVSTTDFAQGAPLLVGDPLTVTGTTLVIGVDEGTSPLDPGTNYWIRIRSRNASGESQNSNVQTLVPLPGTPILNPISLPDVTQTSVNINWAAVSGVVDDYQVELSPTDFAQGATLLTGYPLALTGTSLAIGIDAGTNQLDPGTNYWIRTRSRNATGESPNSNSETFLTKPATPVLNAPDVSDIGQTTALISWSQVSGIVDNYLVDASQDGFQTFISGFNATNIPNTEVEVTGLDPGVAYEARVRANNGSGESTNSNVIGLLTIPANPTATAAAAITSNSFQATWNEAVGADAYVVEVSEDNFATFIFQDTVTNLLLLDITELLPGSMYQYRVRSLNATGVSDFSNAITVTTEITVSPSPLAISDLSFDSQFPRGQESSIVSISVSGGQGNYVVNLRSKGILEASFGADQNLSPDVNGDYMFTFSSAMLDEMGLQFEVEISDGVDVVSDINNFIYWSFGDTQSDEIPFERFGGTENSWNLFSIPYDLDDNLIATIFDETGALEYKKEWRLMHYRNTGGGTYVDAGAGINRIELGKGYWFNAKQSVTVKIGSGQVNSSIPFRLNLDQGWTQIGNPYNISISWNQVLVDNGSPAEVGTLQVFNGLQQAIGDVLAPFDGGFVWADQATAVDISPLTAMTGGRSGVMAANKITSHQLDQPEWIVHLNLETTNGPNRIGGFGMHPEASLLKDEFDGMALPRFIVFTDLYTIHEDYFYPWFSRDVVPTSQEYTWTFTLESNQIIGNANLIWDHQSLRENEAELYFLDKNTGRLVDMKTQGSCSIDLKGNSFPFEIYYMADPEAKFSINNLLLGNAFPNPASTRTTIPVSLPQSLGPYNMNLSIYDLNGKLVTTLAAGSYEPGYYEFEWEITDEALQAGAKGMFFYQLIANDNVIVKKLLII